MASLKLRHQQTRARPATAFSLPDDGKSEIFPYEDLVAYAVGELDAFHSTIVARHVASCAACAAQLTRVRFNCAPARGSKRGSASRLFPALNSAGLVPGPHRQRREVIGL
jgi:anti-sigma factor RsiW